MNRILGFALSAVMTVTAIAEANVLDKMLAHKAAQAQLDASTGKQSDRVFVGGGYDVDFEVIAGNCLDVTLQGQSGGMKEEVFSECMERHFGSDGVGSGITAAEYATVINELGDLLLKLEVGGNDDYDSALPFHSDMVKTLAQTIIKTATGLKSNGSGASTAVTVADVDPVDVDTEGSPLPTVVDADPTSDGATATPAAPAADDGVTLGTIAMWLAIITGILALNFLYWYRRSKVRKS